MPPPVASLERALDQVVDFLGRAEQTSRVRALVIEARRLRKIVGNWHSIAPPDDMREEMITRVLKLASEAEEVVGPADLPARPDGVEPELDVGGAGRRSRASAPPKRPTPAPYQRPAPAAVPGPPPQLPRLPSLQLVIPGGALDAGARPELDATPVAPAAERTEVSRFQPPMDARPDLDGPTIPDLPRAAWDDPPPPPPAEPVTLPRLPSLQITMPAAVREAIRARPPIEPVAPPAPEIIEGPPSLLIDREPPPSSSSWEHEVTLTAIPIGALAMQSISVWSVPRPEAVDPEIVMLADPYSKRADAYRTLRRKLASGTARTIAVTSALPREGKTVCAINLAAALAETSPRNVLLVEANIRSPGLAAALKFEPPTCFAEQLRQHRRDPGEPWVVVEHSDGSDAPPPSRASVRGKVHLLAIDARKERPPILDPIAFSEGMASLKRAGYEYIILDTPPVLGSMDMSVVGDLVDGVILTSLVKKSTRASLRQAVEQLKPAPVLGVVVLER